MTHHVRPLSKKLGIQCHILEQAHWKIKSLRILCSSAFLELQSSVPPQWFWIHIFFMSFLLSCPSDTFLSNLCVCRASFPHSFFPSSFFTQKKRGWKSKIFLLLLPLALLLIKRDLRDLLICSSLLEAYLLPSFLLTSCLVFYICSLSFPQYSYINCPLFSSSHLCPPLKIFQNSCWESDR